MSEGALGTAFVLVRPNTDAFRAELEAQLLTAIATAKVPPVVVPVEVVTATTGAGAATKEAEARTAALKAQGAVLLGTTEAEVALAAANTSVATTSLEEAAALQTAGAVTKKKAVEDHAAAAAAREHAVAQEQLTRGATASGLSLLGIRGATLAASAPFLVGAAAVTLFAKSVSEAADKEEAAARVTRILGDELGRGSEEWAGKLANSFGLSATAALRFEGSIAEVFHNVGTSASVTAQFSQQLVTLSADVAAFNNVANDQVLRAFQLALSGNLRGLRQFVPGVTAASVAQRALADTGKDTVASLTQQELVTARYEEILAKASNQVGAFRDRQGNLAAQSKILRSELSNLADSIGGPLIHALATVAKNASQDIVLIGRLIDLTKKLPEPTDKASDSQTHFQQVLAKTREELIKSAINPLGVLSDAIDGFPLHTKKINDAIEITIADFNRMRTDLPLVTTEFLTLDQAFGKAAADFRKGLVLSVTQPLNQLATLNDRLTRVQISGGSLQAQLTVAVEARKKADQALANADAAVGKLSGPGATGFATARKKQQEALQADQAAHQQEQGIRDQIASQQATATSKRQQARADAKQAAQQALDDQDQALLTAQQFAQGQVEIAKQRAAGTKTLSDDLAAEQRDLAVTNAQIVAAQKIHDANLRLQTIQQLTLHSIQVQAEIAATQEQARQQARAARVGAAEAQVTKASLDAQIAETLGRPKDQIAALRRENAALEAERKLWVGNTVKQKEITLEIARNNAQIKDLKKQQDARNNAANELGFSFLQAQQGFAANLLSNLLPGGAARAALTPQVAPPAAPVPGPGAALASGAAVSSAGAVGGATQGQFSQLIEISRAMLLALQNLTTATRHPEARYQRGVSAADMAHPV